MNHGLWTLIAMDLNVVKPSESWSQACSMYVIPFLDQVCSRPFTVDISCSYVRCCVEGLNRESPMHMTSWMISHVSMSPSNFWIVQFADLL